MKSVLSGGKGFIGSHLCLRLLEMGHEVKLIDRFMMADPVKLRDYLELENPDYIFHLSAYGNHYDQIDDDLTFYTNIENTWNLLKASKNVPYKKLINFGSSSEYGTKNSPMSEKDLLETKNMYGATKASTTYLCNAYSEKYKKNITTVRPFSVYGEGEASFRFIPTVINSIRTAKKFPLDPYPQHDWIYISDFVDGVIKCLKTKDKVVNIGTGSQFTNMQVVNFLEEIAGSESSYNLISGIRDYDSNNWQADNSLLKSLGWKQKHSLREGLKKTYERYY